MGLTARSASWERRLLRLEREVRRLGACMDVYSFPFEMIRSDNNLLEAIY
jgi:hypothetical protein